MKAVKAPCAFDTRAILSSPTKSCTLDPIPTFLLKELVDVLLPYRTSMINASLREGDTEARHTHTALEETVFRLQRPEELPASSFELGVHIQGRRKNHRSEARQLPPGA